MYNELSYIKELSKLGPAEKFMVHKWLGSDLHCDSATEYLDLGFLQYSEKKITLHPLTFWRLMSTIVVVPQR